MHAKTNSLRWLADFFSFFFLPLLPSRRFLKEKGVKKATRSKKQGRDFKSKNLLLYEDVLSAEVLSVRNVWARSQIIGGVE